MAGGLDIASLPFEDGRSAATAQVAAPAVNTGFADFGSASNGSGGLFPSNARGGSDAFSLWKKWVKATPQIDRETRVAATSGQGVPAQSAAGGEIVFGMASAFTGAAKDSGRAMKVGVDTAFAQANEGGGVYGRQLRLVSADDGYEPARTVAAMAKLADQDKVMGYIGNFGTATAMVGAPFALEHKMLFFGAFTGSAVLRRDPPDRYVFNYRPGYADETEETVKYLVKVRRIPPEQIAVLTQDDGFGDSGFSGVQRAMRALRGERAPEILRMRYTRNSIDVSDAVRQLQARRKTVKAVVMVATYRAAAKFIERTKDLMPNLIYTDVSGVGSTSLADELTLLGPKYAEGVIVTQIVPSVDSYASAIIDYKTALAKYAPGEKPDYVSLEGYVVANLLIDGLRKAGPNLTTETLVDGLEQLHDVDMGLGTTMSFGRTNHQASHKVWGTVLGANGHYEALDLQ